MSEPTPDPASLALRLAQVPPGSVGAGLALQAGDVLLANDILMDAFYTDVRPLIIEWRERHGLPANPVAAFNDSGYLKKIAADRVGGTQAGWGA